MSAEKWKSEVLQPGSGPIWGDRYLPSTPDHVLWGRLPCATDDPVLTVEPGTEVTFDTVSHEGILEDQGRDPKAFFGQYDVAAVLDDAIEIAASEVPHTFGVDGPHVVSRPVRVEGARPGDLLAITVLETLPRVPYGVISKRHGKGALPGEYPLGEGPVSIFATAKDGYGELPSSDVPVRFALNPFLGVMGVAVSGSERPHSVPPGPHGGN